MSLVFFANTLVLRTIARAVRDRKGSTAIEYGLIIALVVIAMIAGLTALAHATTGLWAGIDTKVAAAR